MKGSQPFQVRSVYKGRKFVIQSAQIECAVFHRLFHRIVQIALPHRVKTRVEVDLASGPEYRKRCLASGFGSARRSFHNGCSGPALLAL
jgi:hypothetical protein